MINLRKTLCVILSIYSFAFSGCIKKHPVATQDSTSQGKNLCDSIHVDLSILDLAKAKKFVVKGVNSNETIAALKDINGIAIVALEADMRPGRLSSEGFLGKNESLLQLMVNDNVCVLEKLKTTHQELIGRVLNFLNKAKAATAKCFRNCEFSYQGTPYSVTFGLTLGYQESPFEDGTRGSEENSIKNLKNGATISRFSELNLEMAYRYGFYEGKNLAYRLDPATIDKVIPKI